MLATILLALLAAAQSAGRYVAPMPVPPTPGPQVPGSAIPAGSLEIVLERPRGGEILHRGRSDRVQARLDWVMGTPRPLFCVVRYRNVVTRRYAAASAYVQVREGGTWGADLVVPDRHRLPDAGDGRLEYQLEILFYGRHEGSDTFVPLGRVDVVDLTLR